MTIEEKINKIRLSFRKRIPFRFERIKCVCRAAENEHNDKCRCCFSANDERDWSTSKSVKMEKMEIPLCMQTQSNQLITSLSQHTHIKINQPLCYAMQRMHLIGNERGMPCNL